MEANTFVIRPVRQADLLAMKALAKHVGPGFTSLSDPSRLERFIDVSEHSFREQIEPKGRLYLFVLESLQENRVVGCCGLEAYAGYHEPFYNFEIFFEEYHSEQVKKHIIHPMLRLVTKFSDTSELRTLFLLPEFRRPRWGEMLSRSRFLFLKAFGHLFSDTVVAEMRGVSTQEGISPFWEGLGRHFFNMGFLEADVLTLSGKEYIVDLMPKHPIYLDLLPKEAQQVVARAHPHTEAALKLLQREGFSCQNYIDVFDGGPLVQAQKKDVKTIQQTYRYTVRAIQSSLVNPNPAMIGNNRLNYRFTSGLVQIEGKDAILPVDMAERLTVTEGDTVFICWL